MDEQRLTAILFAATILAARKLNEIGVKSCPAREAPSRTPSLTHSKSLRELTSAGLAAIPTIHKSSDVDSLYRTVDFSRLRSGVRWSFRSLRPVSSGLRHGRGPESRTPLFLFTRKNGEPVRDMRKTWDPLVKAAGLPGLLLHDFRRSAVRNMVRRGIPQKTARTISGHKSDSIFSRYNIVSEDDIRDAAKKIEAGAKAVMHSSFTVEAQEKENQKEENARKPV